jgi:hypothetical protein
VNGPARAADRVVRVGYQKASVALALLKAQGLLEQRLAPRRPSDSRRGPRDRPRARGRSRR